MTHVVQLVVEAAGVADGLAIVVATPQRGVGGAAVGARHAHAPISVGRLLTTGIHWSVVGHSSLYDCHSTVNGYINLMLM